MKKLSRLIFPLILALLCAGVIWFLHILPSAKAPWYTLTGPLL